MHLDPQDWAQLSRLLDEVLDLPENEWSAWLDRQTGISEALRASLRQRLAEEAAGGGDNPLPPLPQYTDTGGAATAAATLQAGSAVGPYRIVRELGRGGMGSVWLAERSDGVLKRPVALKLPHTGLASIQLAERLAHERDILASLAHPHIARLYDAGISEQGQPYLALEYIEGQALLDYCKAQGLGLAGRLQLFLQVLEAVQYAHGRLVVHRDLKPGNILVTANGEVRLLDFGVAKLLQADTDAELTETHQAPMTPRYAAPEQILGQPVGIAADIYALGVLLFELISDARPYKLARDTRGALEDAILAAEPASPSQAGRGQVPWAHALRGDLDTITLKALKKAPDQRYTTAAAFADDLRRHLAGEPVLARPDTFAYRSGKFVQRHRWAVAAAGSAVLALVVALGVALWQARVAREQTVVAKKEAATAQAINEFMQGVFSASSSEQANPAQARQRTARELLDIAAGSIDGSLKNAPEAKLSLLKMFAIIYNQLGLFEPSLAMMERHAQETRRLHGADSIELADSLAVLYIAQRMFDIDHPGQAPALAEAGRILADAKDPPLALRMLQRMNAAEYFAEHDPQRARTFLAEGMEMVAREDGNPDFEDEADLLVIGTRVEIDAGDCASARTHADRAVERSRQFIETQPMRNTGGYTTLALGLELGGWARGCLGDTSAAEAMLRLATEASRKTFGSEDFDTLRSEAHWAEMLLALGRADEAAPLGAHGLAALATHQAKERSRLHFDALSAAAHFQWRLGRFEQALDLAQRARALRDPAIDASPAIAAVLRIEAAALAGLGRKAQAQATLSRAVAMRQKALVTTGPALAEEATIVATLAAR